MRKTTINTLIMPPTLCNNAITTIFIFKLCETNLKGRSVLRSLRILITGILTPSKAFQQNIICMKLPMSMRLEKTMKESSRFQLSLKQESSSIMRPQVMIFRTISNVKSALKTQSMLEENLINLISISLLGLSGR